MMQDGVALIADRDRPGFEVGTAERLAKAGVEGTETTPPSLKAPKGTQRIISAPLDRLWKAKAITAREYDAGDTFRADAYLAAVDPSAGSVDWNRAGGGGASGKVPSMFSAQQVADARIRYRRVEKRITGMVWTVLQSALIYEHGLDEIGYSVFAVVGRTREAYCAGLGGFRVALATLSDYYRS